MEFKYEIELAGRIVKIEPDTWREISDCIHYEQWFFIVYMGKCYKYFSTHSYYDRPALYSFHLVEKPANEYIKYIFIK